ncbi:MAG: peptidylprolyl isomerase [Nitrospinales bacterium]
MMSSIKLTNHALGGIILCLVFIKPSLVEGKVFDRVVAKVNSEIITLSSIEGRANALKEKYRNDMGNYDDKKILGETLEILIDEKLKLQQGKKMGFEVDDLTVDAAIKDIERKNSLEEGQLAFMIEAEGKSLETYKNVIRNQILVSKITRFELGSRLAISERKIAEYYHDNQKEFWESSQVKAKHILILFEKDVSDKIKKEKNKQIKKILAEVKEGKDFAEAAKEYSEDVSASLGGDVGFVKKGQMVPEFEKAVYRLKEGEISGVVETEYGYHIIKAEEIKKGRTIPFKDVKNKIKNILSTSKQESAYKAWISELRESAFIEKSLFEEPKEELNSKLFDLKTNHKNSSGSSYSKAFNKKTNLKIQDKWKEMYKSVEKTKDQSDDKMNSLPSKIEQNLRKIKKLRYQDKISADEYKRRKQKLLDEL